MNCCVQGDVLAVSCNVGKQNFAHALMTSMVRICENDSYLALLIGLLRGQSQNFWSGPRTLHSIHELPQPLNKEDQRFLQLLTELLVPGAEILLHMGQTDDQALMSPDGDSADGGAATAAAHDSTESLRLAQDSTGSLRLLLRTVLRV